MSDELDAARDEALFRHVRTFTWSFATTGALVIAAALLGFDPLDVL